MNRRLFLSGSLLMLAGPLAAEAQQAGKVYPFAVLSALSAPAYEAFMARCASGNSDTRKTKTWRVLALRDARPWLPPVHAWGPRTRGVSLSPAPAQGG